MRRRLSLGFSLPEDESEEKATEIRTISDAARIKRKKQDGR